VELTRYTIDSSVEKQILTGMIVSSDFLKNIIPSYDSDYFRSSFVKRVSQWILEYYNIYNQAPLKNIESIYEAERERLDPNEATLIASFLSTLSREFEALESFNTDYHVQQTLRYYKKREIEIRARNALALVEKDKTEDAEAEMLGLKKISKATSNCYNPFEQRFIAESFAAKESDFFRFPGAFGDFVGPLRQGWTVLIAGKYKGYKSSYCLETAFLTSSSKIPTVYVSLEMLRPDINERIYKRITAYGEEASNIYIYPRFDCEMNQTGECNRNERENRVQLKTEENPNPEFTQDSPYRVCSWCRNNDPELYQQAIWFEAVERPKYTYDNVYQKIDDYSKYYGNDYLRVLCYPRFGASVNDVFRDLDMLEHIHGFVPKAVIWDQPEITRSDDRFKSDWESINNIWMRIVGRASEKGYLLFAPSQVTTEALGAAQIKSSNIGRARQILGHVDVAMAINTTTQANRMNVTKIGLLEHRHKKMFEDDELLILRNLDVGQAYLDSIIKRGSSR